MYLGDTFLIPSGPRDLKHLFVVCTDEALPPDFRLPVSISTIRPGKFHDPTCYVEIGEHPFINQPSFVEYRHAIQKTSGRISANLQAGEYSSRQPVAKDLLDRVIAGFQLSDFTEPWALEFLKTNSNLT